MTSTAHRPKAAKSRSLTHIADELSVLKADSSINEALENLHSGDPDLQASGEAQLQALIATEDDLRQAANGLLWSAHRDERQAAALSGELDFLLQQVNALKTQQNRYLDRARSKRVYACAQLDHHFRDEKTHPTPFGNLGSVKVKPQLVNTRGSSLGVTDIPEDYQWLISKQEVTKTQKVIDQQKLLDGLARGEKYDFVQLKPNTTRFY